MLKTASHTRIADSDDRLLNMVLDVLATYRLTALLKDDKVTEDIRNYVWKNYGEPSDDDCHKLSYFLSCPWCLSIYFGAAAVVAGSRWPKVWRPISKALALSAATGFIAEAKG